MKELFLMIIPEKEDICLLNVTQIKEQGLYIQIKIMRKNARIKNICQA